MLWRKALAVRIRLHGSVLHRRVYCYGIQLISDPACFRHLRCSSRALHQYEKLSQLPTRQERLLHCESERAWGDDDQVVVECEAEGQRQQGTLWIMLLLHATYNNINTVLPIIKKAECEGLEVSAGVMRDVVMAFIRNSNVDAALLLHYRSRGHHQPPHDGAATTCLALATLLVECGRGSEALINLKELLQSITPGREEVKKVRADCRKLLDAAASTCDYSLTQELFNQLLRAGWIQPENFSVVPLLQCKMNSGDLVGVVEVAEQVFQDYKLLPKRMEILIALLKDYAEKSLEVSVPTCLKSGGESGDPLGRMLRLLAECYGEGQARLDLFFACLESGHPTPAARVFQMLGADVDRAQVVKMCGLYGRAGREDTLLHLLSVLEPGHTDTLRHKVYSALLDVYIGVGGEAEGRKGLGLYQAMLSEDLTPSPAFLASLAHLLAAVGVVLPPALTPYCPTLPPALTPYCLTMPPLPF